MGWSPLYPVHNILLLVPLFVKREPRALGSFINYATLKGVSKV